MNALNEKIIKEISDAGFGFAICYARSEREGHIIVSAEDYDDVKGRAADYYGEFRGGYPWVHPELDAIADKYDSYWEWENPGAIILYAD